MRLRGTPLALFPVPAETVTNRHFAGRVAAPFGAIYLPSAVIPLLPEAPANAQPFLEDDNRGAVSPEPVATLDGLEFYLSVKGVGTSTAPYSWRPLDRWYAAELSHDPRVRESLGRPAPAGPDRFITGEVWLRGSPYGGQGWEHASTALAISERADLTSIHGFRIAPVVQVAFLPDSLAADLRTIYWYRQYTGRIVQELRLVPSNVRVYFHARNTVGNNVRDVFDLFEVSTPERALRFETNFVRTTVAMLTLFARTMEPRDSNGTFRGLDFHDVWLDKDAVVAPNGEVYFVDLEGIEEEAVDRAQVREKIEDQVFRSLYELTFAYEQIEEERRRRFGDSGSRTDHFESVLREALAEDRFVRVRGEGAHVDLEIRNNCQEESLYVRFRTVDR